MIENTKIINSNSISEISNTLFEIEKDKNMCLVILKFSDESSFVAQNKLDELLIEQIEDFPKPILSVINKRARGLLFEVILASHLCMASENAVIEISNREKLISQIGLKNAEKLENIENKIDAKTALNIGLINRIGSLEDIEQEAFRMAESISKLAPVAITNCLQAVNQGLEMKLEEGLKLETELFSKIFSTEDMREGTSAFLEKRKPIFVGK